MTDVISLREYIDKRNTINPVKIQTFCRLMQKVSDAIEKEDRYIIRVNLDEIKINIQTGEIILPDNLFSDLDKTIVGINTGISLMADRKSSEEHKRVAFALMILGWYCNNDGSSIASDINVLENFEEYMSSVPEWLREYFISIFRKMDYNTTFSEYYKKNFVDKIKNDILEVMKPYNLNEDQLNRITSVIIKMTGNMIKEGDYNRK